MAPTPDWERLFAEALKARERAHAPYSKFKVGAAALTPDGQVVTGCNMENASYGLSVCAERHALQAAVLRGSPGFLALAVVADSEEPTPPCGMCRQVMAEFAGPDVPVWSRNLKGAEARSTVGELLPHAFGPGFL